MSRVYTHMYYQDDWLVHVILKDGRVYIFNVELWSEWPEHGTLEYDGVQRTVHCAACKLAENLAERNAEPFCTVDINQTVGQIQQAINDIAMLLSDLDLFKKNSRIGEFAMTPKESVEFTYTELARRGLHDWIVIVDDTVRAIGRCFSGSRKITLSRRYLYTASDEQIRDTILHEIAHALVGGEHGHDNIWKAKAVELGAKPERCAAVSTLHKYQLVCPNCSARFQKRSRRSVSKTYCNKCRTACVWEEVDYQRLN